MYSFTRIQNTAMYMCRKFVYLEAQINLSSCLSFYLPIYLYAYSCSLSVISSASLPKRRLACWGVAPPGIGEGLQVAKKDATQTNERPRAVLKRIAFMILPCFAYLSE